MRWTSLLTGGLVCLFLGIGCAKVNMEYDKEVTPTDVLTIPLDFKREQKIIITVNAEKHPVDVFVYETKNEEAAQTSIYGEKNEHLLAHARKVQEAKLDATIPSGSPAVLQITCRAKSTPVKVKITSP